MGSMKMDQWKLFNMNDRIKGFFKKTNRGSMTYGTKPKVMTFLSLESQERASVVQSKYLKTY